MVSGGTAESRALPKTVSIPRNLPDLSVDFWSLICEEEWTFLPLSACRHAVRTLSFPTQVRVGIWLVVSEDSGSSFGRRDLRG
jgi:hypothetical protein